MLLNIAQRVYLIYAFIGLLAIFASSDDVHDTTKNICAESSMNYTFLLNSTATLLYCPCNRSPVDPADLIISIEHHQSPIHEPYLYEIYIAGRLHPDLKTTHSVSCAACCQLTIDKVQFYHAGTYRFRFQRIGLPARDDVDLIYLTVFGTVTQTRTLIPNLISEHVTNLTSNLSTTALKTAHTTSEPLPVEQSTPMATVESVVGSDSSLVITLMVLVAVLVVVIAVFMFYTICKNRSDQEINLLSCEQLILKVNSYQTLTLPRLPQQISVELDVEYNYPEANLYSSPYSSTLEAGVIRERNSGADEVNAYATSSVLTSDRLNRRPGAEHTSGGEINSKENLLLASELHIDELNDDDDNSIHVCSLCRENLSIVIESENLDHDHDQDQDCNQDQHQNQDRNQKQNQDQRQYQDQDHSQNQYHNQNQYEDQDQDHNQDLFQDHNPDQEQDPYNDQDQDQDQMPEDQYLQLTEDHITPPHDSEYLTLIAEPEILDTTTFDTTNSMPSSEIDDEMNEYEEIKPQESANPYSILVLAKSAYKI